MDEAIATKDNFFLYRTRGMSMFPYICDGETLVIRRLDPGQISCGDIILFAAKDPAVKVAHFVAKKYTQAGKVFFQTRASRGCCLEEPVSFDRINGKVVALKRGAMVFNLDAAGRRDVLYLLSCFWYRCLYGLRMIFGPLARIFRR